MLWEDVRLAALDTESHKRAVRWAGVGAAPMVFRTTPSESYQVNAAVDALVLLI